MCCTYLSILERLVDGRGILALARISFVLINDNNFVINFFQFPSHHFFLHFLKGSLFFHQMLREFQHNILTCTQLRFKLWVNGDVEYRTGTLETRFLRYRTSSDGESNSVRTPVTPEDDDTSPVDRELQINAKIRENEIPSPRKFSIIPANLDGMCDRVAPSFPHLSFRTTSSMRLGSTQFFRCRSLILLFTLFSLLNPRLVSKRLVSFVSLLTFRKKPRKGLRRRDFGT